MLYCTYGFDTIYINPSHDPFIPRELTEDQVQVSSSYVWDLDERKQVASLKEGLTRVCVGLSPSACEELDNSVSGALRVLGGIQIGSNVFKTVRNGKVMVVETPEGLQILRVNLETGGVAIGEDTQVPDHGTCAELAVVCIH